MEELLKITDLAVEFKTERAIVHALNGLSLTIHKGESLGLVGESGSGKSVTAMSVSGLLPRDKTEVQGSIMLDGREILTCPEQELLQIQGNDLAVVFQEPMTSLDPVMRIGPQVEESLRVHTRLSAAERRERALEALRQAELPDPEAVYRRYPHELSGGMLQRVMIAAAIISRPKLLLADEPTTALDVTIQAQILDLLRNLKDRINSSIMLITHDLGVIAEMADYVVVMYAGRVVEKGTAQEIFANPAHPYTIGLFDSLPDIENDASTLKVIQGMVPDPANLPDGCKFHPRCPYATEACQTGKIKPVKLSDSHMVRCNRFSDTEV